MAANRRTYTGFTFNPASEGPGKSLVFDVAGGGVAGPSSRSCINRPKRAENEPTALPMNGWNLGNTSDAI
jgi:hypothetical protein